MELVFIRHGFSEWNAKNLFTGWRDVNLTERGVEEAKAAGKKLFEKGYEFDIAFTSVLTRAIKTCNIVLEESHQLWIPQVKNWRLNERHYGALQGLDKKATAEQYGDEQVHIWCCTKRRKLKINLRTCITILGRSNCSSNAFW